jgi:hypothetical protein
MCVDRDSTLIRLEAKNMRFWLQLRLSIPDRRVLASNEKHTSAITLPSGDGIQQYSMATSPRYEQQRAKSETKKQASALQEQQGLDEAEVDKD